MNQVWEKISDIFQCPYTGVPLRLHNDTHTLVGTDNKMSYPIKDGIIDFIPSNEFTEDKNKYDEIVELYEQHITHSGYLTKTSNKISWGFIDDFNYVNKIINYIPKNFNGILVDIPVGTGSFTYQKYKELQNTPIIVVDYSFGMLRKAQFNFKKHGLSNIIYIRADVIQLPFKTESIDLLISMNGLHSFPEKNQPLTEMNRIVKPKGQFIGSFYVTGKRKLTDFIVTSFYKKKGWFKPPFYTEEQAIHHLSKHFHFLHHDNLNAMFYFNTLKKRQAY